jgi:TolA-binding protein
MIMKRTVLAVLLAACTIVPAAAACPPPVAGETAEAIAANQQRLVCLQRELAQKSEQYQFKVEINSLDQTIQQMQIQRRFDALNFPKPVTPGF